MKEAFDKLTKKMIFMFDYGEERHLIFELKDVESPPRGEKYPFVTESVGDAPTQWGVR